MFQNIFSKASELSKKAKNIANQYLANQYDPNIPVINEEKIRNMIKDIDNLKDFSLQEYEKKSLGHHTSRNHHHHHHYYYNNNNN